MNGCNRLTVLALFGLLLSVAATTAQSQVTIPDAVGVYFDPAFTVTDATNTAVPHLATAYLVLHNPTQTGGGLGGWECRIRFAEYDPATQWYYSGQALNYKTPPDFVVGMAEPLPITGPDVLLASFDMYIADPAYFTIDLLPLLWTPSVPNAMSYIPWDDKEALTPMATWTGTPTVATYNWFPVCELDRTSMVYDEQVVGTSFVRSLLVTNRGGATLTVDPIVAGTDAFTIGNTNLPALLSRRPRPHHLPR